MPCRTPGRAFAPPRALAGPWWLAVGLLACGGEAGPGPSPEAAPVEAPDRQTPLALEVRHLGSSPGGAGLVVAHDRALGDLVGGPRGLFLAGGGGLESIATGPISGLARAAPEAVAVGSAEGVSVFTGALALSPISDALDDMAVTALAAGEAELWLGTASALLRFADEALYRFDALGGVQALSAAGGRLTVTGPEGVFALAPDGDGWSWIELSAERPLERAFALADGTVLGVYAGALFRRVLLAGGEATWRPQALEPGGAPATDVQAIAQDPARGAVWLATSQAIFRIDGPQVGLQARPSSLGPIEGLAVDELGALWLDDGADLVRLGGASAPVTWQGAVAAFSRDNCERCHVTLGTAHPLDTFEAWTGEIDAILSALEEARMPLDGAPLVGGTAETIRRWKEDGLLF